MDRAEGVTHTLDTASTEKASATVTAVRMRGDGDGFWDVPVVLMRGMVAVIRHGKRWAGTVQWNRKSYMFSGYVKNGNDVIRYQAGSVESLVTEFEISIDEYVKMCADSER